MKFHGCGSSDGVGSVMFDSMKFLFSLNCCETGKDGSSNYGSLSTRQIHAS